MNLFSQIPVLTYTHCFRRSDKLLRMNSRGLNSRLIRALGRWADKKASRLLGGKALAFSPVHIDVGRDELGMATNVWVSFDCGIVPGMPDGTKIKVHDKGPRLH